MLLPKLPPMDLENVLSVTIMLFHISSFLIRELTFLQMKYIIRPMLREFFGLTLLPIILKQLTGQKKWNSFEDPVIVQYLGDLDKLQDAAYTLNQHPEFDVLSPFARSNIKGCKRE